MNVPTEGQDEDADDLLLFEYLEGTLPAEQLKALEVRLAADAALRTELKQWRETFVTEEFCDTAPLAESLLKPPAHPGPTAAFRTLLLVVAPALFWSLPPAPENEPARAALVAARQPTGETHSAAPGVEKPAKIQFPTPTPANRPVVRQEPRSSPTKPDVLSTEPGPFPAEEMRPVERTGPWATHPTPVVWSTPEVKSRRIIPNQPVAGKGVTRQERRQLARRKEKALQARKASEFRKGNVPYVVPLNPRSF